jgi:sulfur relay protein TusB/DsrH
MKTLYIFTKSPWARRDMDDWLPRVDDQDGVLLIQDAVLALKGAPVEVAEGIAGLRGRLFALQADLVARGIAPGSAEGLEDTQAVRLFVEYDRVVSL